MNETDLATPTDGADPVPELSPVRPTGRPIDRRRLAILGGATALLLAFSVAALAASPSPTPSGSAGTGSGWTDEWLPGLADPGWAFDGGPGDPGDLGRHDRGPRHGGKPFGAITIAAIDGRTLSLRTDDGWTRTITVTDATTITKGGEPATFADLEVGTEIRFAQVRNDDGTYTITAIAIVVPRVGGVVTAVTDSSITVQGRGGLARTITTTAATTYRLGTAAAARSDVTVGARIVATGEAASDGAFTATTVRVVPPPVAGEVTAKTATSLTLALLNGGTLTVHVDADTTWRIRGVEDPGIDDVTVGMVVVAAGTGNADGSLDAIAVHAGRGLRGLRGLHDFGIPGMDRVPEAGEEGSTSDG